ncbi:MAG: hypothetical protein H6621_02905 [Halobacteriovoraceae bacterium]|nr:hypothetical protein [Halobacteriovoraceae bacterium]MCB9093994.1 hypothetical protein [Halobacteriovoraceae bacterium]
MFSRKSANSSGASFPEKWQDKTSLNFNEYFQGKYKLENYFFQAFGYIYESEITIILSLIPKETSMSSITLFISKEVDSKLKNNPAKLEKIKDTILDIQGIIFDEVLKDLENVPYSHEWIDYTYKKEKYHYKLTRENVELTLKAEEWLAEDSKSPKNDL